MPRSKGKIQDFGEICLWDDKEGAWIKENDPTFQIRAQNGSRGQLDADLQAPEAVLDPTEAAKMQFLAVL